MPNRMPFAESVAPDLFERFRAWTRASELALEGVEAGLLTAFVKSGVLVASKDQ